MKPLNLMLIALTVLSICANAGDPKKNNTRTQTQKSGGESGGGKPRVPMMSVEEAHERLKEILDNENKPHEIVDTDNAKDIINAPFWMNVKDSFLDMDLTMDWETRKKLAKESGLKISKDSRGRIVVQTSTRDARHALVDNLDDIKSPELKALLTNVTKLTAVDVEFFKQHPKLGKLITIANGHPFDIKKYENLVFMVENIVLDILLLDVRVQKEPCYELHDTDKSEPKAAAVTKFERFTPICFSSEEMSYVPSELFENQFRGLLMHEFAHHYGYHHTFDDEGEVIAGVIEKFQDYYVREVGTGRVLFRVCVRFLAEKIQRIVNPSLPVKYESFTYISDTPLTDISSMISAGDDILLNVRGAGDQLFYRTKAGFKEREKARKALSDAWAVWSEATSGGVDRDKLIKENNVESIKVIINEMMKYYDQAIKAVPSRY